MKIKVDENEKVYLNDKEISNDKINSEFLEKIVEYGLKDELNIETTGDETLPMVKLFADLNDMLKKDSDFRKKIIKIREEKKKNSELANNLKEKSEQDI